MKGEYFGGKLSAALGVFKIVQDGVGEKTTRIHPRTGASIYEAKKGVVSKGFELDVNGEITDNISLSMGLTRFNAKDAKGEKYSTDSSRTTANLFAKYGVQNFRMGAGLMYKSKAYTGSGADKIEQDAYTLANVMFGYKIGKNFDVQLNVDNVFNKKYYEGIGANRMVYGEPRIFNISFSYNF